MTELSKYIKSESVELKRSAIHFADYNPRTLSEEEKKTLKRGIKKFGLVGGLVVNKCTGMTVVSGHQRLTVMDELNKFPDNDYALRVDLIDVDDKQEKELNILLNNPNAQGKWDADKLRSLVPDIDWQDAGLTDVDLNWIGCDYLLQTEEENSLADALTDMMSPVTEMNEADKAQRQLERAEKTAHMKEVKEQVKQATQDKASEMEAYVMLSFNTYEAKAAFMERFGYDPDMKFVKGEVFENQIERIE
ncbi:ParB N-terminal domain-containing protein [Parabacteroides provencensis]|uniref:ParB N-terminal domain-containing protein n=1 Tax=Parabacteroides provencensis TaxID=1944636 RepID=UPI000C158DFA|nr:ParB/RepB/Spo0J family partition protein [Parabacteroides provencensis]